jgi:hypothetical protein
MRLGIWQKLAIYSTTVVVGLSGLLWFIVHDITFDPPDWAHLLLVLHGVSAYLLLLVIGSLLPIHVRAGWLRRRNLVTGLIVLTGMAVLGLTALMLYYGGEELQVLAKWLHVAFGFVCFIAFPAHAFVWRMRRERAGGQLPAARGALSR